MIEKWREHNAALHDARLAANGLSREYMSLEAAARGYHKRVNEWRRAKAESDKAEAAAAAARKNEADAAKRRAAENLTFTNKFYDLEKQIAAEQRARIALGADEQTQLRLKAETLKEAAKYATAAAQRGLDSARASGDIYAIDIAAQELKLAQERERTLEATLRAEEKERREKAAALEAEKKAAAEKAAALEAEKKAAKENEARIKATADERKRQHAEELKALDDEIAKARELAQKLEENASRARSGVSASQWARDEEAAQRDADKAERKRQRMVDNAQKRLAQIAEQRRHGFGRNARTDKEIARLQEFVNNQNPANNPALKQVNELEAKRTALIEQSQKDIAGILAELKGGGLGL